MNYIYITDLNISENPNLNAKNVTSLLNKLQKLKSVSLRRCGGVFSATNFASHSLDLREVDISHCTFDDSDLLMQLKQGLVNANFRRSVNKQSPYYYRLVVTGPHNCGYCSYCSI